MTNHKKDRVHFGSDALLLRWWYAFLGYYPPPFPGGGREDPFRTPPLGIRPHQHRAAECNNRRAVRSEKEKDHEDGQQRRIYREDSKFAASRERASFHRRSESHLSYLRYKETLSFLWQGPLNVKVVGSPLSILGRLCWVSSPCCWREFYEPPPNHCNDPLVEENKFREIKTRLNPPWIVNQFEMSRGPTWMAKQWGNGWREWDQ